MLHDYEGYRLTRAHVHRFQQHFPNSCNCKTQDMYTLCESLSAEGALIAQLVENQPSSNCVQVRIKGGRFSTDLGAVELCCCVFVYK